MQAIVFRTRRSFFESLPRFHMQPESKMLTFRAAAIICTDSSTSSDLGPLSGAEDNEQVSTSEVRSAASACCADFSSNSNLGLSLGAEDSGLSFVSASSSTTTAFLRGKKRVAIPCDVDRECFLMSMLVLKHFVQVEQLKSFFE